MTLTLNLTPKQEQRLLREARARRMDPADLLRQLLADALDRMEDVSSQPPRVPGLHAGHARICDDFDAPLPDSFWTGSE